jgi:sterol desaturase/sphingolipid hydroxylase (fatty acid hydroxylase superfamily)
MTDLVYLLLVGIFLAMLIMERVVPINRQPWDRQWMIRAAIINFAQLAMVWLAAVGINSWLGRLAVFHLQDYVSAPLAGLIAFILGNFVQYWWHRLQHRSDLLWRWLHQLHHSPKHIDVWVANYAHPVDFFIIVSFHAFVALLLLGMDVAGFAWATFFSGLYNYYVHCNVRSPRWLGWFVQRPEMHRVHHRIDHHAQNYGLPVWDLMFGTWHNPKDCEFECGFHDGKEHRLRDMLTGRDVHE